MREWIDTHKQIKRMLSNLKLSLNTSPATYDQIHQSLLIGLLANIGFKSEDKEYLGARNKKFNVFPGSGLFKSSPKWMMSAEIVETTRVYARTNARIDVRWVEEKAKHLLKHHYSNPHWEKKQSRVVAHEQTTLYGLIINPDKKVSYGKINPVEAKEIFIRSALIEGDFESRAKFFIHNRALVDELEKLEAKSRRRDIIVDENILYDFYELHLPDGISSGPELDKWLRAHLEESKILFLSIEDLMRDDATIVSDSLFPDTLEMNGSFFPIEYHFDPRNHCDGITLVTPVAGVNAIHSQKCEWLIPGLLQEKIVALIKSLPKQLRKNFVPAPNFADACVEALQPSDTALCSAVADHLKKMTGVSIPYDAWNITAIGLHLQMNFRVLDNDGKIIEEGRDLPSIKNKLSGHVDAENNRGEVSDIDESYNLDDVGIESIDDLEEVVDLDMQGIVIKGYPALVREGAQINVRALDNRAAAQEETHKALRQLVVKALPEQIKYLRKNIPDIQNLCLKYTDFGNCDDLKLEIINKSIDDVFLYSTIKTKEEFELRIEKGKSQLHDKSLEWSKLMTDILDNYRTIKKIMRNPSLSQLDTVADIQQQIKVLFPKDFITNIDQQWLQQYPRYLSGIKKRFDKSHENAARDRRFRIEFSKLWDEYIKRYQSLVNQHIDSEQLNHYRWMLEEYRVSLFAQELKTIFPISEKRLKSYWREISDT